MNEHQKGFAAFFTTILIIVLLVVLGASLTFLTVAEQRIARNIIGSTQAYYTAEAGAEDALLRLQKGTISSNPYSFECGGGTADISISEEIGGSRTVDSEGDYYGLIRKVKVVYEISSTDISFHYGAQVGEGGMLMSNNSRVRGNIYSNGNIAGAKGGVGYVDETAIVAQNGNRIEMIDVGQDVKAYSCKDSSIGNDLTYVSGGTVDNCSVAGDLLVQSDPIPKENLPISQTQIDEWKADAEEGGIITGDYTLDLGQTEELGPVKIEGNLLLDNQSVLRMKGTIWVTGDFTISNLSTLELTPGYGSSSGVLVMDGKGVVGNNTVLRGSGEEGSYLMLLSTNPETVDTTSPALRINNNSDAAVFYTSQGMVVLRNNVRCREVTGYKIFLDNKAVVEYESGLEQANFTSGPGGSWNVTRWQEVQ